MVAGVECTGDEPDGMVQLWLEERRVEEKKGRATGLVAASRKRAETLCVIEGSVGGAQRVLDAHWRCGCGGQEDGEGWAIEQALGHGAMSAQKRWT